jgi:hypothetical protein
VGCSSSSNYGFTLEATVGIPLLNQKSRGIFEQANPNRKNSVVPPSDNLRLSGFVLSENLIPFVFYVQQGDTGCCPPLFDIYNQNFWGCWAVDIGRSTACFKLG